MNEVRPQLDELLFSSVEGVFVESVEVTDTSVRVEARTTVRRAACPGCGCWSDRRRFVCAEDSCPRKTFAEQVPGSPAGAAGGPSDCERL
ncbi:hypothetical protein GCM10018775_80940 [Streptomyces umbrinus]|nr:hypothetical protein GCM10018775_80940 [Streptomyces umbrinus]